MSSSILFYVLLVIAWFVFSMIKKTKKIIEQNPPLKPTSPSQLPNYKDPSWPVPPPSQAQQKRYFSYEDEVIDETLIQSEDKKNTSNKNILKKVKPSSGEESITHSFSKHPPLTADRERLQNQSIKEEENNVVADFDIKKAIIFSEILKRPEY